jgi:hypothetical protein
MANAQRFPLDNLHRVYVEVDARDVHAQWNEREDIVVQGNGVDAFLEAGELFISASQDRQFNKEPLEIELPQQLPNFAVKAERGDVALDRPQGKLDLRVDSGDVEIANGNGTLSLSSGKGDLKINTFAGNVTANSGSGDKLFSDVTGDVTARSGRGETKMLRGSGAVELMGASGDVIINDRDISRLNVSNASGDVVIRGGRLGRTVIETASGDIACNVPLTIASYDFTAASGDIALSVQRELPLRIDAATTRGSIESDLPLVAIQQRGPRNPHGKRVVGSTSDAAERAEITMRTTSGDIRLQWSSEPVPTTAPPPSAKPEPGAPIPVPAPAPKRPNNDDPTPHDLFDDDDRRRVILNALADGSLSVEEASRLLDAMGAPSGSPNGGR